jgi:competence protein ComEA
MKKLLALFVALLFAVVSFAAVDLNTADEAALIKLPGVGKVTAKAIVTEREANGPFVSFDDLAKRIKGVGKKTVEKLKEAGVTVGAEASASAKE